MRVNDIREVGRRKDRKGKEREGERGKETREGEIIILKRQQKLIIPFVVLACLALLYFLMLLIFFALFFP